MPNTARRTHQDIAAGPRMLDAGHFSGENRRRLSGPGMRTFLNIADLWGLSEAERLRVLGFPGRSTYHGW
ncbi:MAG TPA: antitoxin Xre-like helix-turn-helix domain-containing protein, partial [Acetobacteraceae bacterium]